MQQNNSGTKRSFRYQLATFRFAFNGLKVFFRSEMKSRIHACFAIAAIALGILLDILSIEWIAITLAIGMVYMAEIVNTAIELIVDHIVPEKDKWAGLVKDFSAAAVLVAALSALTIGIIIFLPKILFQLNNIH
jgi:diacylglycerol kinase